MLDAAEAKAAFGIAGLLFSEINLVPIGVAATMPAQPVVIITDRYATKITGREGACSSATASRVRWCSLCPRAPSSLRCTSFAGSLLPKMGATNHLLFVSKPTAKRRRAP
jgi:hypothetical protein